MGPNASAVRAAGTGTAEIRYGFGPGARTDGCQKATARVVLVELVALVAPGAVERGHNEARCGGLRGQVTGC
ncbi:hypothetical protein ACWY4P_48380 [Streptomyces sp. LZ34]